MLHTALLVQACSLCCCRQQSAFCAGGVNNTLGKPDLPLSKPAKCLQDDSDKVSQDCLLGALKPCLVLLLQHFWLALTLPTVTNDYIICPFADV